jgi:predicted nuclease of predicted toxin-antitoxin system
VPVRILTDEHISPEVAYRLVEAGFDVVCARDRSLLGWADWDLIRWCIDQGRAMCTKDGPDFEREHRRCEQRGEQHYGVLIVEDWSRDEIYWALRQYLEADSDPSLLINRVVRLTKASPDFIRERSSAQE